MARPPREGPGCRDTETSQSSIPHGSRPGPPRPDPRNGQIRYAHVWLCDLIANTHSLSTPAMGGYIRLWIEMLRRQGAIPDDPKVLARLALAGLPSARSCWSVQIFP